MNAKQDKGRLRDNVDDVVGLLGEKGLKVLRFCLGFEILICRWMKKLLLKLFPNTNKPLVKRSLKDFPECNIPLLIYELKLRNK